MAESDARLHDVARPTRASVRGRPRVAAVAAEWLRFPLFVGAVHFVIVQLTASLAYWYGTPNAPSLPLGNKPRPLTGWADVLVGPLRLWDGLWYKLIAETGIGPAPGTTDAKAAYWPLYPWLMEGVHRVTGISTDVAGYLISNVSFILALMLLYRLVALDFDRAVARRTLWALALFPTAFFFSAVYTESLFLLLAVGTLLAARQGNWWLAGIAGALGALTRSYGVFLALPLAILFVRQRGTNPRRWLPDGLAVALPALGPAIFAWRLDLAWGDPLAFEHVQAQWGRYSAMPWQTLHAAIFGGEHYQGINYGADWSWVGTLLHHPTWATLTGHAFRYGVAESDTLELVCTILFLGLAAIGLSRLPLYQSAYLIPGLVIPLFEPSWRHALMSMPRFGLPLFPLFVVLALLCTRRRLALPALALSALLLVLLTAQFAQWYWVS